MRRIFNWTCSDPLSTSPKLEVEWSYEEEMVVMDGLAPSDARSINQ